MRRTFFGPMRGVLLLALMGGTLVTAALAISGCEVDSFFDPSVVGRWEATPVTVPILDRLDIIDEPKASSIPHTGVRPEDLVPDKSEYVIGAGDYLTVNIFELLQPNQESVENRRVDETGEIRLPVVGGVRAAGKTPTQLEDEIRQTLDRKNILHDATVSVVLQQSRQRTFSVIAEPQTGGTAVGTYVIPKPNFRLFDALALARGVSGQTKTILIFRQTALNPQVAGEQSAKQNNTKNVKPAPRDTGELLNDIMNQGNQPGGSSGSSGSTGNADQEGGENANANQPANRPAPPPGIESGLDQGSSGSPRWVYVNGQYRRAQSKSAASGGETGGTLSHAQQARLNKMITQRIIEVPYDKLNNGDLAYNIIIRPGDVIKIPSRAAGFVYVMGQINRPGAYTVPGENELTLKQLVASAGGLNGLAVPERVDLTRRVGRDQEATVRIDLRAIFDGTAPDIFLKPNDQINVGTNFIATPLAVFRNGLRASYGFGFIVDRNFANRVFGHQF